MEYETENSVGLMKDSEKNKIAIKSYMGRPSKLHRNEMIILEECIENKKVCTVNEIQTYIKDTFDVSYSSKEVREILRKFNLNYYPLLRKYTYESYYNEKIIKKFDI
ncbi:MAG: helix-turn-helix domain-containing protein [Ferroplasma sp.]